MKASHKSPWLFLVQEQLQRKLLVQCEGHRRGKTFASQMEPKEQGQIRHQTKKAAAVFHIKLNSKREGRGETEKEATQHLHCRWYECLVNLGHGDGDGVERVQVGGEVEGKGKGLELMQIWVLMYFSVDPLFCSFHYLLSTSLMQKKSQETLI